MSNKCRAYSASKIGLEKPDNRKAFYAGWDAAIKQAEKQEPVAQAWDEGYQAGVNDERMSEANIGIAGFDAKVEPARNNPYRITQPAPPKREWQGLTDAEIFDVIRLLCADNETAEMLIHVSMDEYRAIEAKLKEKNT